LPGRPVSLGTPSAPAIPATPVSNEREAWVTAVNDPMRRVGFYFGLVYVFLRFSMFQETLTLLVHVNLYLALISGLPAVGLALIGGYFGLAPLGWLLLRRRVTLRQLGPVRYAIVSFLLLTEGGIVLKMVLRWTLSVKYFLVIPGLVNL